MQVRSIFAAGAILAIVSIAAAAGTARANGDLRKVNHVVVMIQENHSFDNYFGVLPYVPDGPYHPCTGRGARTDHQCVNGLACAVGSGGNLDCSNSNPDESGNPIYSFHDPRLCTASDLDHGWIGSHNEANWEQPADSLFSSPNDGFVRQNDVAFPNTQPTAHDTMGYYNQDDLPFYYTLAETFAMDDEYHCGIIGPTLPNRLYSMAATSFGHTTTSETVPPIPAGYRPLTGSFFDLMDKYGVSWKNYYSDLPNSFEFRPTGDPNAVPIAQFVTDAAAGTLPQVSFVDPNFGILSGPAETDEHPPSDIRAGQYFVSQMVNAVRNGPSWQDTVIFLTYDEHGGAYDHVAPPKAPQRNARNPDGIFPGQCKDLSNPPGSTLPGGGANCSISMGDAAGLCPDFTPNGPYPRDCPSFNQLGFRVPFTVISPFSKPHYVSHKLASHSSMLAFIEERFMTRHGRGPHPAMTLRDANANTLQDLFNFNRSPSLNAMIPTAPPPSPSDGGCPPPGGISAPSGQAAKAWRRAVDAGRVVIPAP
ncbi:MAG: phospholipase C [Candidatus Binataceae bacterium]